MKICISLKDVIRACAGVIYCMSPYYTPRKIEIIMSKLIENFKSKSQSIGNDFFFYEIDEKEVYRFFENMLMPIEEFRELNLSKVEYEQGVKIEDENRPEFVFTSAYDTLKEENDFVDLDACIRNIVNEWFAVYDTER